MKYNFEAEDLIEAQQIINSGRMNSVLFELKNNFWRKWKEKDPTGQEVLDALAEVIEEYEAEAGEIYS